MSTSRVSAQLSGGRVRLTESRVSAEQKREGAREEIERSTLCISEKQFAHFLVPAYLDKTEIVGISTLKSVNLWIDLVSFWLEREGCSLPQSDLP